MFEGEIVSGKSSVNVYMYNSFSKVKDEGDTKSTLVVVNKCFV